MAIKAFGAKPPERVFDNPEPTDLRLQGASMATVMWEFFFRKPRLSVPPAPLPAAKTDLSTVQDGLVWFGHSSYFVQTGGMRLGVDLVLSGHASPFSFMTKAFQATYTYTVSDIPDLDILVITHDHYDHLDYETVVALAPRVKTIVTTLGVGAHLQYWGIPGSKIVELGWGGHWGPLTATPARHFSGRTTRRNHTLWASFVLTLGGRRLFLGGDSGYGAHFASIGLEYGPFDLALLECGQYGVHWPYIHMFPEQTYQAALDLRAKALMPVHWGKFSLSLHEWDEPIRRLSAVANGVPLVTPRIGEMVPLGGPYPGKAWWD